MCWRPNGTETQTDKYTHRFPSIVLLAHCFSICAQSVKHGWMALFNQIPVISVRGNSLPLRTCFVFGGNLNVAVCLIVPLKLLHWTAVCCWLSIRCETFSKQCFYGLFCIFSVWFCFWGLKYPVLASCLWYLPDLGTNTLGHYSYYSSCFQGMLHSWSF